MQFLTYSDFTSQIALLQTNLRVAIEITKVHIREQFLSSVLLHSKLIFNIISFYLLLEVEFFPPSFLPQIFWTALIVYFPFFYRLIKAEVEEH